MNTILEDIVAAKRQEIERRKRQVSLEQMKQLAAAQERPRNFFHAVTRQTKKPVNLIAEVKKASPSAGVIRADFDPVAIAQSYAAGGADAISVLTDEPYFQGKLEYISAIRAAVDLPVLRKDFILEEYQVYEARAAGADAILLIAECLTASLMIDLQILSAELKMTCLVEVHDMENLMRVRDQVIGLPHRGYSLLGINNRDLRTFKTDLGVTLRLAELVADRSVLVSESGIHTRTDIAKLAAAEVRAVLVGESLMRQSDIPAAIRELFV
jgi:indole-3-glycerol phosphate synthase